MSKSMEETSSDRSLITGQRSRDEAFSDGSRITDHSQRWFAQTARVLASLWMGSLWTVCGLVAPTLFAVLDDRRLAGDLAGEFFTLATWLGAGFGVALILTLARTADASRRLGFWIAVTALAPVVSEAGLRPFMSVARAAGNMAAFGILHTVSAVLFLIACVGALFVVLKLSRPAG